MRISNNNINEEEKEYWSEWGKKFLSTLIMSTNPVEMAAKFMTFQAMF